MKQFIFLFSLLFIVFTGNYGQTLEWEEETKPAFEVWNANGKIKYTTKAGVEVDKVTTNMSIPEDATITLKKGAILELVYNGQPVPVLDKKGTYALNDLKSKADQSTASGLMGDFWEMVSMAYKGHGGGGIGGGDKGHGGGGIGGGDKGHGGGGIGGGDKGHGGGGIGGGDKGHGGKGSILALAPFGGGITSGQINFRWMDKQQATLAKGHGGGGIGGGDKGHGGGGIGGGDKGHGGGGIGGGDKGHGGKGKMGELYQIKLMSSTNEVPLFSAMTYQNNFSIDLGQIPLETEGELFWQVSVEGGKMSHEIPFSLVNEEQKTTILNNLKQDPAYQKASDFQKRLLEAVTFEKNQMSFLAHKKYQKALKAKPENKVTKWLYDAFLEKNGLEALIN